MTLVVVPNHLLRQWQEQIHRSARANVDLDEADEDPTKLRVLTQCAHDDRPRGWPLARLHEADLVFTTYSNLKIAGRTERSRGSSTKEHKAMARALRGVRWYRVVLDEAHGPLCGSQQLLSQGKMSQLQQTCYALRRQHSWLVTGTPAGKYSRQSGRSARPAALPPHRALLRARLHRASGAAQPLAARRRVVAHVGRMGRCALGRRAAAGGGVAPPRDDPAQLGAGHQGGRGGHPGGQRLAPDRARGRRAGAGLVGGVRLCESRAPVRA